MSVSIIKDPKVVNVGKKQSKLLPKALILGQFIVQKALQIRPVGQMGQRIVHRLLCQVFNEIVSIGFGRVAGEHFHRPYDRPIFLNWIYRCQNGNPISVFVPYEHFFRADNAVTVRRKQRTPRDAQVIAKFVNMVQFRRRTVLSYYLICLITGYLFRAFVPEFYLSVYIHIIHTILNVIQYAQI